MTNLGRAWPPGDEYPKEAGVGDVIIHSRDGTMILTEDGWKPLLEQRRVNVPPANHAERMREWRERNDNGDCGRVATAVIRYIDEELVPVGAPLEEPSLAEKPIADIAREFQKNIAQVFALDDIVGLTRSERLMHVQAVFLRAAVQLFHRGDKVWFARTAKIAWEAVHGREKL